MYEYVEPGICTVGLLPDSRATALARSSYA